MAASVKRWLAPSAAFAAGITATIAVSALISGSPPVTSTGLERFNAAQQASSFECTSGGAGCGEAREDEAAHLNEKLLSNERAWSDPTRSVGSPVSLSQRPPTQLTFRPEAGSERNAPDQPKPASAPDRAAHRLPAGRADAVPAAKAAQSAEIARSRAAEKVTLRAKADPLRRDNFLTEAMKSQQPRIGQARSVQSQVANFHYKADRTVAVLERSAVLRDQSRELPNQPPPRAPLAGNLATKLIATRNMSLPVNRLARINLMQAKELYLPQARRPDTRSQVAVQAKSWSPENEARESKTRLSSAGSGGIMIWLQESGDQYY